MNKQERKPFLPIFIATMTVIILLSLVVFSAFFLTGKGKLFDPTKKKNETQTQEEHPLDNDTQKQVDELQKKVNRYKQIAESSFITVVNADNPLSNGMGSPILSELSSNPSLSMEVNATVQIEKFFAAAEEAGLKYIVTAAFRTANQQTEAYNTAIQNYMKSGYGTEEAEIMAAKSVAKAGESEFQTGYVISFSETKAMTAAEFDQSALYKFATDHIAEYGFILRYPGGKEAITGFDYNPFTFRFVGDP